MSDDNFEHHVREAKFNIEAAIEHYERRDDRSLVITRLLKNCKRKLEQVLLHV